MLNILEVPYDRGQWLVDYLFGVRGNEDSHETFGNFSFLVCSWGAWRQVPVRFEDKWDRLVLSDVVGEEIEAAAKPMLNMRCDFDFNLLPGEEPSYAEDFEKVKDLFREYSSENKITGYIVAHFDQRDKVDGKNVDLARHVHVVYEEPADAQTFSEYLHSRLV